MIETAISTLAMWLAVNWEHIAATIGLAAFIANKLPAGWRENTNELLRFLLKLLDWLAHNYGNTANAGASTGKK